MIKEKVINCKLVDHLLLLKNEAIQCYEEMLLLPGVLDVEYSAKYYTGELERRERLSTILH